VCEHRRALIDAERKRQLEQIPTLRDQVRIVSP
jgi:hypothetical protein